MGKKGDESKKQIIEKAISMYSRYGYDETSFQKISKELDLSHTAPIYHFKNKLGLFKAVVNQVFERAEAIVLDSYEDNDSAEQKLTKYFKGHITWTYIFKNEANVFCLLSYFASFKAEFAEIFSEIANEKRQQIQSILKDTDQMRDEVDRLEFISNVLVDYLHGLILFRLSDQKSAPKVSEINDRINWIIKSSIGR